MSALPFRNSTRPAHGRAEEPPRSALSRGLTIRGRLECEGEVIIQGHVTGRIDADRLVVGPDGVVNGDIVAREVLVRGRFDGRIFAHTVTLDASAEVTGRVFHHTITVERGARIDARMPWRPLNYFETLDQLPEIRP